MFGKTIRAKTGSHRSKLWLICGVFLLSILFSPFTTLQPAYADTADDIHDINYKHYAATYLRDCLYHLPDETKNTVLQARANDPNRFFASSWKVGIGLYLEPTDGVAGCEEGNLIKTALGSLGYADNPGKLLTDIGYTVDKTQLGCGVENAACENGTQNRYTRPASGDKFNDVFANRLAEVPGYAKYVAYRTIFNSQCQLVEPPTGNGAAITYKKVVLKDGKYITEDTEAEFVKNNLGRKDEFDTGKTLIKNYEYENKNITCRDLLAGLNTLTGSVIDYNEKNKDDPISGDFSISGDGTDCDASSPNWDADTKTCKDKNKITCAIEGIGWFLCPTMTLLAQLNDTAYAFLASNFLSINTELVTRSLDAWANFRDLANILFVIAILIVVYSQLTSVGITNYGIKKLLPKIVVAAILVNLSYLICQIAVDLSNILGFGIVKFFSGVSINGVRADTGIVSTVGATVSWAGTWALIAASTVIGVALGVSVPVILSALLAIGLIVLILVARQALIVLLIVIAPLAFVAYLLPNTEQWFKKWAKMFSTLLLLFPIIGVVFGASLLAGNIVFTIAKDDLLMQIVALGVTALPLFVVPGLLKGALTAAGAVGSKLSGWADRSGKNVGKQLGDTTMLGAMNKQYKRARELKRAQVLGGHGGNKLTRGYYRGLTKITPYGKKIAAGSAKTAQTLKNEDVENEVANMQAGWEPHEELGKATEAYKNALTSGDVVKARAAQKILLGKGNAGLKGIQDTIEGGAANSNNAAVLHAKSDLASAGLKSKNAALNAWSYDSDSRSFDDVKNDAKTYTSLSDAEFASQTHATMEHAASVGGVSRERAERIIDNKDLHGSLDDQKFDVLYAAAGRPRGGTPPPPPAAPGGGGSGSGGGSSGGTP